MQKACTYILFLVRTVRRCRFLLRSLDDHEIINQKIILRWNIFPYGVSFPSVACPDTFIPNQGHTCVNVDILSDAVRQYF